MTDLRLNPRRSLPSVSWSRIRPARVAPRRPTHRVGSLDD